MLVLFSFYCSCTAPKEQIFCNFNFSSFRFNNDCINNDLKIIKRRLTSGTESVQFSCSGEIIEYDTLKHISGTPYLLSHYRVNVRDKDVECISIAITLTDTMRRFVFTKEADNNYYLKLFQSFRNDSSIHAIYVSPLLHTEMNEFILSSKKILPIYREKISGAHDIIHYSYIGNIMSYKIIGYYPWKMEPMEFSSIDSRCHMIYIDIRNIDFEFLQI